MDTHIINLLKTNNRVIIPEFGAFIVKSGSPRTIVFNEFLKYDDEVLKKEICNAENISEEEASNMLDDYTLELNSQLNIGQQHKVGTLGILKKDKNGRIHFDMLKEDVVPPAAKEEPKVEKKIEDAPIELETKQETKPELKADVVKEEEKKVEIQKEKTPPEIKQEEKIEQKEEIKAETASKQSEEKPLTINEKLKTSTTTNVPKSEPVPKKEIKQEKKTVSPVSKESKSKNIIWYSIAGVAVIAIVVWFLMANKEYIFDSSSKSKQKAQTDEVVITPNKGDKQETESAQAETDLKPETTKEETKVNEGVAAPKKTETKKEEAPRAQTGSKKYYIVAGCFQIEENANKHVSYLNSQGYNSEKFGRYNNLFAVSFNSFASYNDALKELERIKKSTEPEAWILYY